MTEEKLPVSIGESPQEGEETKAKTIIIQNVETLNLYIVQGRESEKLLELVEETIQLLRNLIPQLISQKASGETVHTAHGEQREEGEAQTKKHFEKHHSEKHEKKGAPSIQTVDELLKFTKGDRKYARNIVRKRKLIGVEFGNTVYAVDPELIDQLKSGAILPEELPEEYQAVAEAIARGKARLLKNVELQNRI